MSDLAREIESIARAMEHEAITTYQQTRDSSELARVNITVNKLKRIASEVRRLEQKR